MDVGDVIKTGLDNGEHVETVPVYLFMRKVVPNDIAVIFLIVSTLSVPVTMYVSVPTTVTKPVSVPVLKACTRASAQSMYPCPCQC